ncbi:STAS domain-containing protein [Lentzea alba]|uniref:STAS domain-containing protein n=1 Tax=Lentzea alba TaxID=2714351 RepID=UPI0039BFFF93
MTEEASLGLVVVRRGAVTSVRVSGEIDLVTAHRLETFLRDHIGGADTVLELDLAEVEFIGSEGLRVLLLVRAECARRQASLVIATCSASVLRTFDLVGLTDHLLGSPGGRSA